MAKSGPENFNVQALTRTDALYFTITVFSTVGFGDISATSQVTRVLVSIQMILDLLILGYGIRLFMGVAERAKSRQPTADRAAAGAAGDSAVGDRPSQ